MSDITMCPGIDCPLKSACKRYTQKPHEFWQSYFLEPPFNINESGFSCDMYWGENAENIYNSLKEAIGLFIPNLNDAVNHVNEQNKDHNL